VVQPTYFATFLLGEQADTPPPSVADVLEHVANWLFKNARRPLARPGDWPNLSDPLVFPGGEKIQVLRWQDEIEGRDVAAVRFEHGDPQSRLLWRTDCIIVRSEKPQPTVGFSVTVAAGGADDSSFVMRPPSSRPRLVYTIMDRYGGRAEFPLKSKYFNIAANEAEPFTGFLLNPKRSMPVVLISRTNHDESLLCDPSQLASTLVGIAYVCVADSVRLSWNLTEHLDNRLNAYDGTVRLYWPRMRAEDAPYRHRWWNARQLRERNINAELLRLIGTASITRYAPGLVRWEDIERENTRRTIQLLQTSANNDASKISDEFWRQYETDLAALDLARKEMAAMSEALLEREGEVRLWKNMYLLAQRARSNDVDSQPADVAGIESADEAIDAAGKDFSDRLEILEGRVAKEASQFEQPELLYAALNWLATTYWNARTGVARCADLDLSCRESCQFKYNAHQSEITMSMYAADYEVSYGGARVKLREHIGYGVSTEPRHTIRVAFFFDEAACKVIVGYVGQHQATRKSN
jgi:hypothetical protein